MAERSLQAVLMRSTKVVLRSSQAPWRLTEAVLGSCKAPVGHGDGLLGAREHRLRRKRDRVEGEIVEGVPGSDAGGIVSINVLVPGQSFRC